MTTLKNGPAAAVVRGAGATDGEAPAGALVTVDSGVLGRLEVPAAAIYTIPNGLVGLPEYRGYALVPAGRAGVFWLQSVEEPGLAFVVADPFHFVADYAADLPDAEVAALGAGTPDDVVVLVVVTLPPAAGGTATANLRAPLVFNAHTRLGRQVVLPDARFTVTETLAL